MTTPQPARGIVFALVCLVAEFRLWAVAMGLVYYLELVIWFCAVRHIDVSLASSVTIPWPAFTMVLAVLLLGETIAPYQVVAVVIVIAAIYGLSWAGLRKARAVG